MKFQKLEMMTRPPTEQDIRKLGKDLYLDLTEEEVRDYQKLIKDMLSTYKTIRSYGPSRRDQRITNRKSGHRAVEDNPYNAWITRCEVKETGSGLLEGWDVAIKDNIALAGVEMTCGSSVMEGYIPEVDATIVRRLLDAGARIVGKTNMDDMAFTGNGHSSAFGPTLNPRKPDYLTGGSSGGSAAVVATGEVDLAIGCDQGGSIRVPSSWTGVVGHKPTRGLVPYTGIIGIENTIDCAGPMAGDVPTLARALSVMAGKDPADPRQPQDVPTENYEQMLNEDLEGLSIGVVEEGFNQPEYEETVNENVRKGLKTLSSLGAKIKNISIPMHLDAQDILFATLAEGALASYQGEGLGHNWRGWYNTSWIEAFGKFKRTQGGDFAPSYKLTLLLGAYMSDHYHSKYYAEAMNLRQTLTEEYNEVLKSHDLLAMPTTPQTAHKYIPSQNRFEFISDAWGSLANTCAFNMTGHPAISVPVNPVDELPVGLMLVGHHWEDPTVLNTAHALEKNL